MDALSPGDVSGTRRRRLFRMSRREAGFGTRDFPVRRGQRVSIGCLAALALCRLASFWPCMRACTCSRGRRGTVHLVVHTGLPRGASLLWWAGSVPNGAFSRLARGHLYPDGVAIESCSIRTAGRVGEVQNVRRDLGPPERRRGGEDRQVGPQIRPFVLVRGPHVEMLRGAKDSLAHLGIGAARLSLRLEHGSTVRQTGEGPQWTDARPLWTPPSIRGTVVRCLN